jgi:hypothetical protein
VSSEPAAYERDGRAAAVNDLLQRIAESNGSKAEWWNHRAYEELAGLTPTQAWLHGDHDGVERLITSWYEATEREAKRRRSDPDFIGMLKRKSEELAEQRRSA